MKQAVKDHARDPFEDEAWEKLAGGMRYTTLDFADDKGEDELRERADISSTRSAARRATASTTSPFLPLRSGR